MYYLKAYDFIDEITCMALVEICLTNNNKILNRSCSWTEFCMKNIITQNRSSKYEFIELNENIIVFFIKLNVLYKFSVKPLLVFRILFIASSK